MHLESVFEVLNKKFICHVFEFQENDFHKFLGIKSGCSSKDGILCVFCCVVCFDFPDVTNKITYAA